MPAAVAITRKDHTAAELRRAATRTDDADAARRMLALAHVLDGRSRGEAAELCGMDRQILRDWVVRYNAEGLDGVYDRPHPGAQPRLSQDQQMLVAQWVRQGPSLSEHGVVRWRRIDLAHAIETHFGVQLAERSVGSLLRRLGFRRLSVRPRHPRQDIADDLPVAVRRHLPPHAQDIYREALNHAFATHVGDPRQEEAAHRIAWAAIKRSYVKVGDSWISRTSGRS